MNYPPLIEAYISEHPAFHKPVKEWGVRAAYVRKAWTDDDGIEYPEEYVPEDRSEHKPEWDGKSLADFWDHDRKCFREDSPKHLHGIQTFVKSNYPYRVNVQDE